MDGIPAIIAQNNIKQYFLSKSLKINLPNFKSNYTDINETTIFIGIFNKEELDLLDKHKGDIYILWLGNDCNPDYESRINNMKRVNKLNIKTHFCLSDRVNDFLIKGNIIKDFIYYKTEFKFDNIQINVSDSLKHLEDRIKKKYNLLDYTDINKPCVFFGAYNDDDIEKIKNHKHIKYIMWGGSDCSFKKRKDNIKEIKNMIDICHIAISHNMIERLNRYNFIFKYFNLDLTNYDIFKPNKNKGNKIFIYNGYNEGNEDTYGKDIYEEVVNVLPQYEFIYSNKLGANYEDMPNIYSQCFIGLRLTKDDGNANMVQEMEAMKIPVIHNLSEYGLKWNSVDDIINHIKKVYPFDDQKINSMNLEYFNKNIDEFSSLISEYKNILFICGDYPGYGGAATNCYNLQKYYSKNHNTYGIYYNFITEKIHKYNYNDEYCIIKFDDIEKKLLDLDFKPDLIILKSFLKFDLKKVFSCPIYYCIGGIYKNNLDKYYFELQYADDYDKYHNISVINQIKEVDRAFSNSKLTQKILKDIYNLDTEIFYSGFIPFYGLKIIEDPDFENRKYEYGLIVSDFNRTIKNVKKSINFLKDKENVILIGRNSLIYKKYGFECVDLIDNNKMTEYYKKIKYIQQDSFYESYSNVKIESIFNGCKIKSSIVVSSTQYPGYGGAATNAYAIIKFLRKKGYNTAGVFFHSSLDVNYDPDNIGGIFLYDYKFVESNVLNDTIKYLGNKPNICLAKNYMAPIYCKRVFNCYTVYLVSGINHLPMFYKNKTAKDVLDDNFFIKDIIFAEVKCNEDCDLIVLNSNLSLHLFNKIYPTFENKIYKEVIDTTQLLNIDYNTNCDNKEYDILICCSMLTRKDKNNMFLIDILKKSIFDNFSKIIIGQNNEDFLDIPNSTCTGLLDQKECVEYMSKCRILLFPSLCDANSNTVREAYYNKCLPLITENIGFHDLFPDFLICKNYEENEWSSKILFILKNYENLKDTKINYSEDNDLLNLFNNDN